LKSQEVAILGEGETMLADQPFVAFIATKDETKARHFYEEVLGLRLVRDEPSAIVFDARGTTVRIQKLDAFDPQTFTVLGWQVPDIDAAIEELAKRKVRFERYPGMDQDERRVWRAPTGARVAWFKDPDGNTLSITQP
jgi:catechol 2,3-dioxygenase-like lactoylglutathione lyase family enzyme